ncbi:GNAT family N-acetyltransferase [Brevibacillus daliensis]|uniref:GNAT family N-acetyltransferase n=1 Tax=Brevibacillus daliensis TaxID=2892995 RepID=UPI001E2D6363|nr:GNAT family N-acetyltransferase [Brevibacillus daliensis]
MQYRLQKRSYEITYPQQERKVIYYQSDKIGRIFLAKDETYWTLVDIAILPTFRGLGNGSQVLKQILDLAQKSKVHVRLQVLHSNSGARLSMNNLASSYVTTLTCIGRWNG